MKHSAHRVKLWWKSSRIFSRISLLSSGDGQSQKTFTPKISMLVFIEQIWRSYLLCYQFWGAWPLLGHHNKKLIQDIIANKKAYTLVPAF